MLSITLCIVALSAAALSAPVDDDVGKSPEAFDASIMTDPNASPQTHMDDTEGDMAYTPEQKRIIAEIEDDKKHNRHSSIDKRVNLRWDGAVIPYYFDCSIAHRPNAVKQTLAAMAEWESKTCIRFEKYDPKKHKYAMMLFRGSHCWAYVGQVTNSRISIGEGCDFQHVMAHEIGHVVGMYHEQNRKDRDTYVNIHWNEIGQFKSAFRIEELGISMGVPYDMASIMHYPWSAFSATGRDTMSPKKGMNPLGKEPYIGLSSDDALQTSLMYDCPKIEADRKKQGDHAYYEMPIHIRERRALLPQPEMEVQEDDSVCENKHHDTKACEDWRAAGFCTEHQFMKQSCRKTCFLCGTAPCKNEFDDSTCEAWSRGGYCRSDSRMRNKWCPKTCATNCAPPKPPTQAPPTQPPTQPPPTTQPPPKPSTNPPPPTQAPPSKAPTQAPTGGTKAPPPTAPTKHDRDFFGVGILCFDKDSRCGKWAKMGECDRNPGWMLYNCMLSCPTAHCDKAVKKPDDTCADPLGIAFDGSGSFKIPDSALTSTDIWRPGGGWDAAAANGRLYFMDDHDKKRIGAWCPTEAQRNNPSTMYMTIDLGRTKNIKYIASQGRDRYFEHVKTYTVSYSNDGSNFTPYQEGGAEKVLIGNCDNLTPVLNKFTTPFTARFVRVQPKTWYANGCMRLELYGC